jgi:hypothetical protein
VSQHRPRPSFEENPCRLGHTWCYVTALVRLHRPALNVPVKPGQAAQNHPLGGAVEDRDSHTEDHQATRLRARVSVPDRLGPCPLASPSVAQRSRQAGADTAITRKSTAIRVFATPSAAPTLRLAGAPRVPRGRRALSEQRGDHSRAESGAVSEQAIASASKARRPEMEAPTTSTTRTEIDMAEHQTQTPTVIPGPVAAATRSHPENGGHRTVRWRR